MDNLVDELEKEHEKEEGRKRKKKDGAGLVWRGTRWQLY